MKSGSTGEMTPITRITSRFSARTAWPASRAIALKVFQSLSSWKSQWDMLFGSFQIITASTGISALHSPGRIHRAGVSLLDGLLERPAHVDLGMRMIDQLETGGSQHGLGAGPVGDPPVGGILRELLLDEVQLGELGAVEDLLLGERIVVLHAHGAAGAPSHRLEDQPVPHHVIM